MTTEYIPLLHNTCMAQWSKHTCGCYIAYPYGAYA